MGNDLKCSLSHVGSSGVLSKNSHGLTNHSEILVWRTIGSKQSIAHGGIIRVKMTVSSLLLSPLLKETIYVSIAGKHPLPTPHRSVQLHFTIESRANDFNYIRMYP